MRGTNRTFILSVIKIHANGFDFYFAALHGIMGGAANVIYCLMDFRVPFLSIPSDGRVWFLLLLMMK